MNPCALTKPTLSLVSVTGSKVDFYFHGRKIRVFVSGREVKDLPKNLQKIHNATQLRLFMKNAYLLTRETKNGPFLHVRQRGLGGQKYTVTINGQVVTSDDRQTFLDLLLPQLQRLGFASQVIQRLQEEVNNQSLQTIQLQNRIDDVYLQLQHSQDETWIALYRERLHGDDFLNAAIYFAKISQTNQKTVLNALIQGGDSKIFQLGFHLISNHEITEGKEIVESVFPEQVAAIILHWQTKSFAFSLDVDKYGKKGWQMAVGNFCQDKRNHASNWVMAIDPQGASDRGSWRLEPINDGEAFHIIWSHPSETEPYYLSSHGHQEDIRSDDSFYVMAHKPGFGKKHWKIRYLSQEAFAIELSGNDAGNQLQWNLRASRYFPKDKRFELSSWLMVHRPRSDGPDLWRITKEENQDGGEK